MFKADKCLRTPSVCLIVLIVVYFRWLWKPALNRLWGCWFISFRWSMPLVRQFRTRYLMLSRLTSVHLYLLSTRLAFLSFLWLSQRRRELWMIFLAHSLTYSLSFLLSLSLSLRLSLSLLLHLSSGFKRLSSSLAPRSSWPLPFICQPFDVVPAWAARYALPLTARPGVRGGLCFKTPPRLNTLPLPPPQPSTTTSHLPCRCVRLWCPPLHRPLPSLGSSLPQCPLLFYSLVLHSFHSGCGGRQTFGFIAYTCPWRSPSAGRDKTARGRWPIGASHLNSPHLELIVGGPVCGSTSALCQWGFNL